jgi:septal ring factor EnvC (AmiA/AmiB activator)
MARPKGSKNKTKVLDGIDYAAQIAEKNTATKSLAEEIAALGTNIAALNTERKAKEAELKKLNKEIAKLEKKKADADEKIAEAAKKAEAEDVLKKLLAEGMSTDEILEKLK